MNDPQEPYWPKFKAPAALLPEPWETACAYLHFCLACGSPSASPLVSPKEHFWGSASSAGAGGPHAHVSRAPSDCEHGDQMAYDVTKTACEGLCISADNSKSPCLQGGESLALYRVLSQSEGRDVRAARRRLPAHTHPNPFRWSVPLLFCLV